jgi:NAD(P)-dependent dehydrogenase (short-subunit alcohol dehydrogenase family)
VTVRKPLALVTGGMRRVGAAIAIRLAIAGYDLALSSHADASPEPELVATMAHHGTSWHAFVSDLSDPSLAEGLIDAVVTQFGRAPDLLVNNAAMFGQDEWQSMDANSLTAHFGLNVFAPLLLAKALVAAGAPGDTPSIVHIVDQRIDNPHPDQISYTLSKQALAASVRTMATAFGARARVNAVAPGLVIVTDDYQPGQAERLAQLMPLGSLPSVNGVAEAVLYLAGASDVTGQILYVDGGAHLKSFARDFMHL